MMTSASTRHDDAAKACALPSRARAGLRHATWDRAPAIHTSRAATFRARHATRCRAAARAQAHAADDALAGRRSARDWLRCTLIGRQVTAPPAARKMIVRPRGAWRCTSLATRRRGAIFHTPAGALALVGEPLSILGHAQPYTRRRLYA